MRKFKDLRKKYPRFIYEGYSYRISKNNLNATQKFCNLEIFFDFFIKPNISFQPRITIEKVEKHQLNRAGDRVLNNLIFHLGLIEMISYWKATCSPEIIIKAGPLNSEQIKWWKDLIIKGMGQFFYENKIDFRKSNLLKIISYKNIRKKAFLAPMKGRILIPVGGGKDSVVSLEILKKNKKINCFSLNPTPAARAIMKIGDCKKPIIVRRKIDEKLLELNRKGFLNGHTPFSAYLAFLSVLVGTIFNYKYIAFSNERSSNEGNIKYLGRMINHQWSKSFGFEKKFRNYSKKHLLKNIEYFSFLRPLYEIQIARLFSKYPKYFPIFLSCNEAYKTKSGTKRPAGKWCGNCPKCLFVFACLYPFIEKQKLIKIFRKNLFKDRKLLPLMQELIGQRKFKPFECVGTKKESLVAFYSSWKKANRVGDKSLLLSYFENKILPQYPNLEKESKKIMTSWNNQNFLPAEFIRFLKTVVEK